MTALYFHIPFCLKKCAYCDFCSFVRTDDEKRRYSDLLLREIELCAERYKDREIGTVFIGGGTPSCMPYGEISRIMRKVFSVFNIDARAEITIECNPGTVDAKKLDEYLSCGINRISFGLQSTHDTLLRGIGRIHTYSDFLTSLDLAKKCGFSNINADIMYGLPAQTEKLFRETLDEVVRRGLTHISAYSLILEEGTPLYERVQAGELKLPPEDEEYAMHRAAVDILQKAGYHRYEISNYALAGYECRHNLTYWDVKEYIGAGLNSHSCIFENGQQERHANTADLREYEKMLLSGRLPIKESSIIPPDEQMKEFIMLGTRKTDGFSLAEFKRRFGREFSEAYGDLLKHIDKKYYNPDDNFSLTDEGLDMQNLVLCELL